ncbi:MAG: hypothetical protein J0M25_04555 [Flavobacteriales bacterium]|nr:hypothetical protein [Flavobacteriales bacterium]
MKIVLYTFLILILTSSKQAETDSIYLELAKSLIEKNDVEQLKSLQLKFLTYQKDSSTVFMNGWYYYDTVNQKYQNSRGTTVGLKNNIYWFLLIDNLQFGHYTWEIDWKQPESEILGIISALAKKKNYTLPKIPSAKDDEKIDAGGRLKFYNKTIKKNGFTLVNLYIDSDTYVTAILKKENFKKISILAQKTGNKISEY